MQFEAQLHNISLVMICHVLTVWASGWRYATTPQTASDYITKLIRPSRFFLHTLKNMEGLGTRLIHYNNTQSLILVLSIIIIVAIKKKVHEHPISLMLTATVVISHGNEIWCIQ